MGWSFRKSINLGPIRLNLSKSGIGFSTGVRGFRVSTGPRGTRLNAGVGPLHYTKTLSSGHAPVTHPQATPDGDVPPIPTDRPAGPVVKMLAALVLIVVLAGVGLIVLVVVAILRAR